jgi:hypothetical protein
VVVGPIKAGKSTLVNALVSRRVAPTGVVETTRFATYFRYGSDEHVELHGRDGEIWKEPVGHDTALPLDLGRRGVKVNKAMVSLSNDVLRHLIVIDTPGLESSNSASSDITRGLLRVDEQSATGMADADVMVYVMDRASLKSDMEVIRQFRRHGDGLRTSVVNTIGVLSKADLADAGGDRLEVAAQMAAQAAEDLQDEIATVVPVVGLWAETASAARLSEADVRALSQIARLSHSERSRMLLFADGLRDLSPLPRRTSDRLLELLGLFGIQKCVEYLASTHESGDQVGAREIYGLLFDLSGINQLRTNIVQTFAQRGDALKADAGMAVLERISYHPADASELLVLETLRQQLEALRLHPRMHILLEVTTLHEVTTRAGDVPGELVAELERVVRGRSAVEKLGMADASAEEARAAALAGVKRWRTFTNAGAPSPTAKRAATVLYGSYELLLAELEAATSPAQQ